MPGDKILSPFKRDFQLLQRLRLHGNIFILATQDPTGGMKFSGAKQLSDACNHYFFLSRDEIQLFHVVLFNLLRSNIFQNRIFFKNTLSLQMVT